MKNYLLRPLTILRVAVAIGCSTLCALAAAQSPVTISLALNSPTQAAATPTTARITVADSAGPVRFGMVDILDGNQTVQTLQLVSTTGSGFTPGTATLRHIFAPGTQQLAAFRGTTADAAATSSPVALTVSSGAYTSSSALSYAQTVDFAVNKAYNATVDVVVADFNNDGIPDIAAVQGYPNAVAISLADRPGHYLPPTNLPITSNNDNSFLRVLAADLDADGLVDLIVTGGGDDYTVFFRNNPAAPGTFLAPAKLIADQGTPIAIADFNHYPGAPTSPVAGALPLGLLALLLARPKAGNAMERQRRFVGGRSLFLAAGPLASLLVLTSCGRSGSAPAPPQTLYPPSGTYHLSITAVSGAIVHTTTFTVTIQ